MLENCPFEKQNKEIVHLNKKFAATVYTEINYSIDFETNVVGFGLDFVR